MRVLTSSLLAKRAIFPWHTCTWYWYSKVLRVQYECSDKSGKIKNAKNFSIFPNCVPTIDI